MVCPGGCRGFVAFVLKMLNFVQAFIGTAMILYSIWMFSRWKSHSHSPPPSPSPLPPSPSPLPPSLPPCLPSPFAPAPVFPFREGFSSGFLPEELKQQKEQLLGIDFRISASDRSNSRKLGQYNALYDGLDLTVQKLPALWFIYTCLAIGIIVCVVTCFGHIAAEVTNGCCLCCYSVLILLLILLEAALVGYIFFDHSWEKKIPEDPTGAFENVKTFIKENIGICKWVGFTIVTVQAISLLLALILRAMVPTRRPDYESDDDYAPLRMTGTQPSSGLQAAQASVPTAGEHTSRIDAWTQRMREKYGINPNKFSYNTTETQDTAGNVTSGENTQGRCCVIM